MKCKTCNDKFHSGDDVVDVNDDSYHFTCIEQRHTNDTDTLNILWRVSYKYKTIAQMVREKEATM